MEIQPHVGVGKILFNSSREDVRRYLSEYSIELFKRTADSATSFYIKELDVFIYFDRNGFCEAVEFASLDNLYFNKINLSNFSYQELEDWISSQDELIEIDETGFSSFKLGIGGYIPDKENGNNEKAESVIVFRKGYYD